MKTEQILAQQQERIARATEFTIDGFEDTFAGYTFGQTWNGWACPCFDRETAQKVIDANNKLAGEYDNHSLLYWDGEKIMEKYEDGEIYDMSHPTEIKTENGTIKVWDVGSHNWSWWDESWGQ